MTQEFDIAICGGGLVGATLALALADSPLRVAMIEGRQPAPPTGEAWDSRIYAVSPRNRHLLQQLGAWQRLPLDRIGNVQDMRVRGDAGGTLHFSAVDVGSDELATIIENSTLQTAIWSALADRGNVSLLCPARPQGVEWGQQAATLILEDGQTLKTRLLVAADGAESWLRQQAGIGISQAPYEQQGVVANFECSRPHGFVARQWFRQDGVLAWLPLPGNRISIVWSTHDAKAAELKALPADALCEAVAAAGGRELGELRLITPAAGFPLRLTHVKSLVSPRLALIGDAAHTVHPLAGQGVNLGFQDARVLADVLLGAGRRDPGDYLLLRRYERARREDVMMMQAVTHGLDRLFRPQQAPVAWLRNAGLTLTDKMGPLKRLLIRQAL